MSTRSRIGIIRKNRAIDTVYCHSDGYPSWNGRILLENYTDQAKIEELLKLGDLSSLDAEIGESCPFDARVDGLTCAYHRDRGEPFNANSFESMHQLETFLRKSDQEWCYLYDEASGYWQFSPVSWNWTYNSVGARQKLPDRPFEWKRLTKRAVADRRSA